MRTKNELIDKYDLSKSSLTDSVYTTLQNTKIFGISGQIGSGKDTVGNCLKELIENEYNQEIVQVSFADALKEEINEILAAIETKTIAEVARQFNIGENNVKQLLAFMKNDTAYSRTPNSRLGIQYWGTDCRRAQNENYWVNKAVERILALVSQGNFVYVTDARHVNEMQALEDLGATILRLNINEQERIARIIKRDGFAPDKRQLNHSSETSLNDYPFLFVIADPKVPPKVAAEELLKRANI